MCKEERQQGPAPDPLEFRRRCDAYLAERAKGRSFHSAAVPAAGLAEAVLPGIRAALTYETGPAVLHLDASPEALAFAAAAEGRALAAAGLACPDHVLATKVVPLVVDVAPDADAEAVGIEASAKTAPATVSMRPGRRVFFIVVSPNRQDCFLKSTESAR